MKLPKRYVPDSLTEKQKKAQVKSIKEQRDRPNQEKKTKRSSHTIAFEKKYGTTIMNDSFIDTFFLHHHHHQRDRTMKRLGGGVASFWKRRRK